MEPSRRRTVPSTAYPTPAPCRASAIPTCTRNASRGPRGGYTSREFGTRRTVGQREHRLDDGQAHTMLEPAGLEHPSSVARAHPLHKAMLTLARDAFWLPGSLHGGVPRPLPRKIPRHYTGCAALLSNILSRPGATVRP